MNFVLYSSIEKSGTGIKKSSITISFYRSMTALIFLLVFSLVWIGSAVAVAGNGTGTSSTSYPQTIPAVLVNDDLVTVSLFDGYRIAGGYGYLERNFAEIPIYSLEYVHVIGTNPHDGSASLLVAGNGTGAPDQGGDIQEVVPPVAGNGTGSDSGAGNENQLQPWGIAEIVFSERGTADVIVYRFNAEGTLEEVGVHSGVEVR